jgi:hypothetical protein
MGVLKDLLAMDLRSMGKFLQGREIGGRTLNISFCQNKTIEENILGD